MKRLILLIVLLLSFASVAFSYEEVETTDFIKEEIEITNYIKNNIAKNENLLYTIKINIPNPLIEVWLYFLEGEDLNHGYFLIYKDNVLQNNKYDDFKGIIWCDASFEKIFDYTGSTLQKQIEKFRCGGNTVFVYDFNHDGIDEILSFSDDTSISTAINSVSLMGDYKWLFYYEKTISTKTKIEEFIIFNGKRGLKAYTSNWAFYYYDRIQQKYVQDENATSEELEQIHGSPDFFAEAGIDYAKLERPLLPADLEGFSKAALRIWRNAIYARHGRIFKSEDLQALFNEYIWYEPDENYSDDKLTDTDLANIKLIQEFEEK